VNPPAIADNEPWLTKRELAATLKVSPRTIERERVPAMRVGGQNRYRLSEVERFFFNGRSSADVVRMRPAR